VFAALQRAAFAAPYEGLRARRARSQEAPWPGLAQRARRVSEKKLSAVSENK
jgi:hypothetical protein